MPSSRLAVRRDQPAREQVQPQPDVLGVGRRGGQVGDRRRAAPHGVRRARRRRPSSAVSSPGAVASVGGAPERGRGEPDVEDVAGGVVRREAEAPGRGSHAFNPTESAMRTPNSRGPGGQRWAGVTGRCGRRCTRAAGRRARRAGRTPRSCVRRCRAPRSSRRRTSTTRGRGPGASEHITGMVDLAAPQGERLVDQIAGSTSPTLKPPSSSLEEPRQVRLGLDHPAEPATARPAPCGAPVPSSDIEEGGTDRVPSCSGVRSSHFSASVLR